MMPGQPQIREVSVKQLVPTLLAPPKADPFVEDHLIPSAGSIPTLGVVPVLAVGGLLAYSARRSQMEEATEGGEE